MANAQKRIRIRSNSHRPLPLLSLSSLPLRGYRRDDKRWCNRGLSFRRGFNLNFMPCLTLRATKGITLWILTIEYFAGTIFFFFLWRFGWRLVQIILAIDNYCSCWFQYRFTGKVILLFGFVWNSSVDIFLLSVKMAKLNKFKSLKICKQSYS